MPWTQGGSCSLDPPQSRVQGPGLHRDLIADVLRTQPIDRTASDRQSTIMSAEVRLDVWLDVSCLFRTRSEAQKACKSGKIAINGQPAKPHRLVHEGDQLEIKRPFGRRQQIVVRAVADRHIARAAARELYEDRTPKPTAEEIETRRLERMYRAAMTPPRAPDKRARRAVRKLKEGQS